MAAQGKAGTSPYLRIPIGNLLTSGRGHFVADLNVNPILIGGLSIALEAGGWREASKERGLHDVFVPLRGGSHETYQDHIQVSLNAVAPWRPKRSC